MTRHLLPLLLAFPIMVGACDQSGIAPLEPPSFLPTEGDRYVVSEIRTAQTAGDARFTALDLNGDDVPDNQLGQMIGVAYGFFGGDPQDDLDEAMERGEMLHLLAIGAPDDEFLDTARVFLGEDTDDDPSNNGRGALLRVREDSTQRAALFGVNDSPTLSYADGRVALENTLFGSVILPLTAARLEATVAPDGAIHGLIAGGIKEADIQSGLVPALAVSVLNDVEADCAGTVYPDCCESESRGEAWMALFDRDQDCAMTSVDVTESAIISALFAPDLDLDLDGENDALSVGFGFSAVPASFEVPASPR